MSQQWQPRRLGAWSVDEFLAALSSASATPGGGSASAVASALGAGLAAMVARLTAGRAADAAFQEQMRALVSQAEALKSRLVHLADADMQAYAAVIAAGKLSRGSDAEATRRTSALQAALVAATEVPLEIASSCLEVLKLTTKIARHGNRNAASDAAVAALLAHAGLLGAVRSARTNLQRIPELSFSETAQRQMQRLLGEGEMLLAEALSAADA